MEDDDLDYDITFPSPSPVQEEENDEDDDITLDDFVIEGDRKEPVIILIGWAGCEDRYLAKYSQIYEKRGCITIRYIPPKDIAYFQPHLVRPLARKVLDLISDYNLEENPILFHIFSNNGCLLYSEITDILHSSEGQSYSKYQVKGTVIDSAPGKRRVLQAAKAYMITSGRSGITGYFVFFSVVVALLFGRLYSFVLSLIGKKNAGKQHHVYEAIKDDKSRWPQLFLYSKADQIIFHYDIEEIIEYRQKVLNVPMSSVCWNNSDHVSHLRLNRESYITQCRYFLEQCMKRDTAAENA